MAKGVPTARSKRYKANQTLQEMSNSINIKEKVHSTPSTYGNDVLPSPTPIPETDGAHRAFEMARVLTQTLMHMNPANHISDILKLLGSSISDCSAWYHEVHDRNIALQQQLDDLNSKMLSQDSAILNLQDQLNKVRWLKSFTATKLSKLIWSLLAAIAVLFPIIAGITVIAINRNIASSIWR